MLSAQDNLSSSALSSGTTSGLPKSDRRKVIVIDDDELMRALVRSLLEEINYLALPASTGVEGLALYTQHPDVSLVITDMAMPGMDGADVISALRRIDSKLRIMAMSGFMPEANRVPKDILFLSKPFEKESFVRAVHAALT